MKQFFHDFRTLTALLWLGAAVSASAASSVTSTHLSISDTATVVVKATVSSGAKADVYIYLDSNANGKIDSGEIVWRHFKVQDGQALPPDGAQTVVDTDGATNGSITATVFTLPSENVLAGHFVIRVVSGSSTIDVALVIDPPGGSQSVSGQLLLGGVTPAPGAVFILDNSGNFIFPLLTDASGKFTAPLPSPGTYQISGIIPGNGYSDQSGVSVTVSAGQAKKNVNVMLPQFSHRWKGQVVRADNQKPVPGIWITARRVSPPIKVSGPTDDNGNFDMAIDDGTWTVQFDDAERMGFYTANYDNGGQAFLVSGHDVTGKLYQLTPVAAYVYGRFRNSKTLAGLAGIHLDAQTADTRQWLAQATSNDHGNFALGMAAGTYVFQPNFDSESTGLMSSILLPNGNYNRTVTAGQNVDLGTLDCPPPDGQLKVTVLDYPNIKHAGDSLFGVDNNIPTGGFRSGSIAIGSDGTATVPIRNDGQWEVGISNDNGQPLVPQHRLDILAALGNTLTIYPNNYRKRPYWVYGGVSGGKSGNYPQDWGFKLLGKASGTHTFAGPYNYYAIVAYDGPVLVDTIEGSNRLFYGVFGSSNVTNPERIGGIGDRSYGLIGGTTVPGFALIYSGTTLSGITVIHPDEPYSAARDWWRYDAPAAPR